jgi:biopolymer transport protein TolQ
VIGYNRFSYQVDRLEVRYDNFKEEFSSILQRQAHALSGE